MGIVLTMACIGTWSFSLSAVERCAQRISENCNCLDALEEGINRKERSRGKSFNLVSLEIEDDPTTGRYLIGRGCYPNSEGLVQLDAAVMNGKDLNFGSVCALEG